MLALWRHELFLVTPSFFIVIMLIDQKPNDRYVEDKSESGPGFEQRRWEEEHLNAALLKFGAKDAKQKSSVSRSVGWEKVSLVRLFFANSEMIYGKTRQNVVSSRSSVGCIRRPFVIHHKVSWSYVYLENCLTSNHQNLHRHPHRPHRGYGVTSCFRFTSDWLIILARTAKNASGCVVQNELGSQMAKQKLFGKSSSKGWPHFASQTIGWR